MFRRTKRKSDQQPLLESTNCHQQSKKVKTSCLCNNDRVVSIPTILSPIEPSMNFDFTVPTTTNWMLASKDSFDHSQASVRHGLISMCASSTSLFYWNILLIHENLFEYIRIPKQNQPMGDVLRMIARKANNSVIQQQHYIGLCAEHWQLPVITAPWISMGVLEDEQTLLAIPQGWTPPQVRRFYRNLEEYYAVSFDDEPKTFFEV